MRGIRSLALPLLLGLLAGPAARCDEWAEGVPYTTDWEFGIRKAQETGRILFVYTGWRTEGNCHVSDAARRALETLAKGDDKKFAKYRESLQSNFVLVGDFLKSAAEENSTHGPEEKEYEPYRIEVGYTPLMTFKKATGETIVSRVGIPLKPEEALTDLAGLLDQALKGNGPVKPPAKTRPLVQAFDAAERELQAGRIARAIRGYEKVVELGGDEKKFPERTPVTALDARKALSRLEARGFQEVDSAVELARSDPEEGRKKLQILGRQYAGLKRVEERISAALERL
ncbi:MAG: hypothetical protein V2A76_06825 [Planctomycetota bacterium]